MLKKQHFLLLLAVFLIFVMATGCGTPQKKRQVQLDARDESQIQVNTELAERAREASGTVKGVKESTAVVIDRDIAIAVKVVRFDRLRLKKIRQEVHDRVKELDQSYNVYVTTDKKLFKQLQEMEQELSSPGEGLPLQELQARFKKLIQDILK
ncbi:MAG TPA: YhcN/YlaJ family sporulation lipoprotein [Bacillota bacterium]|jgi:PHD/YefM family antitoxin component YafN of YafNO toxin-antitoxin module|nr:YhcN/YlaJ family sporulation lipoprotein [Peptococcaceae bacterium MAG4]NLW38627.1 sporulation protein [Peptococcaceae bacterium]HPU35483.1 YhcN/YlaJ family sporulation lipoprotein [Bacillota bacterium]HPZ43937.1 YhcN/YlaJ family sporulation lipoprotein [Bacillota bacterium]HQD76425.1 YhcN/YlaJ family sporulation lipoprotein [Bacillota bacterium]